jgi:peptide/nickel transport system substrate-binding protein
VKTVARNRTFVSEGWDSTGGSIEYPTNFNPYLGNGFQQRNVMNYTIYESLFYTNFMAGNVLPWQATEWKYNADYTQITITLRKGVKWSDGQAFDSADVVYTLNMLKKSAPEIGFAATIVDWVKDVQAPDAQTVVISLNKPGPRFGNDILATGQGGNRLVIMPEHIWKDQDPKTFTFYDPAKGWPVGTGPYKIVKTDNQSQFYDVRDTWWAVESGFVAKMPAIERIVFAPAKVDALANLYTNNDLDVGLSIPVGQFEAARAKNPKLTAWNSSGPVWGAPDGCVYRLTFNNQRPPFDDPEIHWAINYAIDRKQVIALALEGSTFTAVAPFAPDALQKYLAQMQDVFAKYKVDSPDKNKTAEIMTKKGYKKDAQGFWVKPDGKRLTLTIGVTQTDVLTPVMVQQLQNAGFDTTTQVLAGASFTAAATSGEFDLHSWVHCGSVYDPWQTLDHYHSKYAAPAGKPITFARAYTRYANPDLDKILNQLEAMVPSPDDQKYMTLVKQATDIYLRDLPDLTLALELQILPMNTTYWTGYPSSKDPYIAPYIPWEGFNQVILKLKPTQ